MEAHQISKLASDARSQADQSCHLAIGQTGQASMEIINYLTDVKGNSIKEPLSFGELAKIRSGRGALPRWSRVNGRPVDLSVGNQLAQVLYLMGTAMPCEGIDCAPAWAFYTLPTSRLAHDQRGHFG